jgi:hypothetical protein
VKERTSDVTKATVYVHNKAKLRIRTSRPYLTKQFWKDALPYRVPITFDWGAGEWHISFLHLETVIRLLRQNYDKVEVHTRHSGTQICNWNCQNAKGNDCVCSCEGTRHKQGDPGSFYRQLPNDVLVISTDEKVAVRVFGRI